MCAILISLFLCVFSLLYSPPSAASYFSIPIITVVILLCFYIAGKGEFYQTWINDNEDERKKAHIIIVMMLSDFDGSLPS